MTTMNLTTLADADAAARHAADTVARLAGAAIAARDVAHVALAAGSIMEDVHERLAKADVDWSATHLWLSDERAVAPNDDDSNFKMIVRTLLDAVDVPAGNVHRVRGEDGADAAADAYEADIRASVAGLVFDVVLCGMGPDGHTCSLFPGFPQLKIEDRLVVGVHDSPKPPPGRITFTLPLIHRARQTLLVATGTGKADAMAAVLAGPDPHVPASLLRFGTLEVITDEAAVPT